MSYLSTFQDIISINVFRTDNKRKYVQEYGVYHQYSYSIILML